MYLLEKQCAGVFISRWSQPCHFINKFRFCLIKVWQRSHKG